MPIPLQRLWIQITSDRRRFGMLAGGLLLGALLWARIIVISNPPRTAVAGEETEVVEPKVERSAGHTAAADKGRTPATPVLLARDPQRDPF